MIKLATKNDLEGVSKLRDYGHSIHANNNPKLFKEIISKEANNYLNEILENPNFCIYVSIIDDKIVAYAIICIREKPENPVMYKQKICFIEDICVDKNYQKQGIGKELFKSIKDFAKDNECNEIELNVWEFNKNAISFYEHLGFKTSRRIMGLEV